jgi:hypothetical protein
MGLWGPSAAAERRGSTLMASHTTHRHSERRYTSASVPLTADTSLGNSNMWRAGSTEKVKENATEVDLILVYCPPFWESIKREIK